MGSGVRQRRIAKDDGKLTRKVNEIIRQESERGIDKSLFFFAQ